MVPSDSITNSSGIWSGCNQEQQSQHIPTIWTSHNNRCPPQSGPVMMTQRPPFRLLTGVERERFTSKYPHFFVGTLQPLQTDWKGRPQCVCCFSASVLVALPQGKTPRSPYKRLGVEPPTSHTASGCTTR